MIGTHQSRRIRFFGGMLFVAFILFQGMGWAQVKIDVDLGDEQQTMDGVGGNAYGFILGSSWSPEVLNKIVNDINVTHVRIRSFIDLWEPANDNSDPESINWSGFKDEKQVHDDLKLMQKLSEGGIKPILGVFDAPDWMVVNPGNSKNRVVPPNMYPEFAEMVVSFVLHAKQKYGVDIETLSLQNEPNIGIYVYWSPEELVDISKALFVLLDKYGLSHVKLHVGDVNKPTAGVDWYAPSLEDPKVAARAAAVSFHTWENMTKDYLGEIKAFAQAKGVPTWATEVGTSSLNNTTYDWAVGSMKMHHYAMKYANSSMTFQWTLGGAESSIAKNGDPYPVYYALKHFHQHITPGSVRVETHGDMSCFLTTAFVDKEAKALTMVAVDTDCYEQDAKFTLHSGGNDVWYGPVTVYKTSTSLNYEKVGTLMVAPDNTFVYPVESRSFHTFTCPYNTRPEVSVEIKPAGGSSDFVDFVVTLSDGDGIDEDMLVAGIALFKDGVEQDIYHYDDPGKPDLFEVSIDPTGTVLTMTLRALPKKDGFSAVGGGVDEGGMMALMMRKF